MRIYVVVAEADTGSVTLLLQSFHANVVAFIADKQKISNLWLFAFG